MFFCKNISVKPEYGANNTKFCLMCNHGNKIMTSRPHGMSSMYKDTTSSTFSKLVFEVQRQQKLITKVHKLKGEGFDFRRVSKSDQ